MKTSELIALLANDAGPRRPTRIVVALVLAAAAGAAVSGAILLAWLGLRPMHEAIRASSFWMKAAYTATIAISALAATARLARPGGRIGGAVWLAALAVAVLAMLAGMETMRAPPGALAEVWLGQTWNVCAVRIVALSVPVFIAALAALRGAAPTRPVLAGAVAGLFAGAVGATVYGLYCEETTAAFTLAWYSLGMAACAGLGAVIGGRLLRW